METSLPIPTRRQLLQSTAAGFGWLAFAALHAQWSRGAEPAKYQSPLAPKPQHFAAKAKRVIFFFMAGGPSHVDTFDWKPELAKVPPGGGHHKHLAPVFAFKPSGKSGLPIADIFPHLAKQADHLCLLNGMHTAVAGHQQATVAVHTGNPSFVRPSLGSWVTYGLGSEADDLPGFVTLNPLSDQGGARITARRSSPRPIRERGSAPVRAACRISSTAISLRAISGSNSISSKHANRRLLAQDPNDPALQGLIESYELAYKMQSSVPATLDINRETAATQALYGLDDPATSAFAAQCLTARRLAEKGVRFIQLTSQGWDQHNNLREAHRRNATAIDKPIAGLIADLSQRGMLDETLLVWGGEFGRTPATTRGTATAADTPTRVTACGSAAAA